MPSENGSNPGPGCRRTFATASHTLAENREGRTRLPDRVDRLGLEAEPTPRYALRSRTRPGRNAARSHILLVLLTDYFHCGAPRKRNGQSGAVRSRNRIGPGNTPAIRL